MKTASLAECSSKHCKTRTKMSPRLRQYLDASIEVFSERGKITLRDVGAVVGTSPSSVFAAVSRLVVLGHLKRVDWGGYKHCYLPASTPKPLVVEMFEEIRKHEDEIPQWMQRFGQLWKEPA